MTDVRPTASASPADAAWREIETLVDEIAGLSRAELAPGEFYAELLQRVVAGLAALGGAVWLRSPQGQLQLERHTELGTALLAENRAEQDRHRSLVERVLQSGEGRIFAPDGERRGADGPGDHVLLVCPLVVDRRSIGAVEIVQRRSATASAYEGHLQLLSAVCELAADYHRNRQLRELRERESLREEFDRFALAVHQSLDLERTAHVIANEGRRLAACDRLTVGLFRGAQCRAAAVSGAERIDRRANTIRRLERLGAMVAASGEPFWFAGVFAGLAPELEEALRSYLDVAEPRRLGVIPLGAAGGAVRGGWLGVLVFEKFDAGPVEPLARRGGQVALHSQAALRNSLEYSSIPLAGLWRRAAQLLDARQLPRTVLALFACAAALAALILIPADFKIEARGELRPQQLRDVFAPMDGEVSELLAEHDQAVQNGQVLLTLRSSELELEFRRVEGEIATARKRLLAVESERLLGDPARSTEDERSSRLSSEEEEIRQLLDSLDRQLEILHRQQQQLQVRSPLRGRVLTWDVKRLLEARPVRRGQMLLSVADVDGPWILELQIPDGRVGRVLAADEESSRELDVSFMLASHPGEAYAGRLEQIAGAVEAVDQRGPLATATVSIDRAEIPQLRPGAEAIAKIHCGRRSIGYVWLHDAIDAIRTRLLF